MSVNIFRLRRITEAAPRSKKGYPPHKTTGVAKKNSIQFTNFIGNILSKGLPGSISKKARMTIGSERNKLTQNRRDRSRYSLFSAETEASVGSSDMPHLGQSPGLSDRTSACMGQVEKGGARGPLLLLTPAPSSPPRPTL